VVVAVNLMHLFTGAAHDHRTRLHHLMHALLRFTSHTEFCCGASLGVHNCMGPFQQSYCSMIPPVWV
jgi:hypothetical protein